MTKTAFHLQTNEDSHNEHMLETQRETTRFCLKKKKKKNPLTHFSLAS